MNILMLPSLFYPLVGGVEVVVANLCREFLRRGHTVEIVTTRWPRELAPCDCIGGVRTSRFPFTLPGGSAKSILTFPFRFVQSFLGIERILASSRFDLVNLHYPSESAFYASLCCGRRRIPIITSLHGSDIQTRHANALQQRVTRNAIQRAAGVTAVSRSVADSAVSLVGQDAEQRMTIVGNGVNVQDYRDGVVRPSGLPDHYVIAVGRMVQVKGFDVLIDAFSMVAKRFPHLDLVLVGDGIECGALKQRGADHGIANRLHFVGQQPNEVVPGFLQYAECVVIPSRREGFGIVALEAMAAGKPVVAMPVGGLSEIIKDNETGVLVQERTAAGLADALVRLLSQPRLAEEIGRRGRLLVEAQYGWESVAERYIDVFTRALAAHREQEDRRHWHLRRRHVPRIGISLT